MARYFQTTLRLFTLCATLCSVVYAEVKFRIRNPSPVTVLAGMLPQFANVAEIQLNGLSSEMVLNVQEIPSQLQTDAEFAPSAEVYASPEDVIVLREAPLGIAGRESAAHNYDSAPFAAGMPAKDFLNHGLVGAFKVVSMREDLGKAYVSVQVGDQGLFVETNPTIQDIPPELIVASIPIKK